MGHDQLFKEFLRAIFRDFLELFCPDIAARLDFGTVRFLEKELFTDFPAGSLREADVVAEVDTQDGIEGLVLVLPAAGQKQDGPLIGVADRANDAFVGGADGAPIQVLPEAPNPRACGRALERVRARKEEIKLCPRRRSPLSQSHLSSLKNASISSAARRLCLIPTWPSSTASRPELSFKQ